MIPIKINNINPVYKSIYTIDKRYLIIYGGAGSGKSYEISKLVISKILSKPECNYLIVRQTAKSNRNTTFNQLKQTIMRNNLYNCFSINKSDLTITNKRFGNQIIFGGLDDVEKLKSTTFENGILTDIWIEEASEINYDDFLQLDLRLRGKLKNSSFQIILSFNPIKKEHWIYKRFFNEIDHRAYILKTTYLDNQYIDDETIKTIEFMKKHNPSYYKVYGLGEWGELTEGLVYPDYKTVDDIPEGDVVFGLDYGYNHATALVMESYHDNNLYVKELIYVTNHTHQQIINLMIAEHRELIGKRPIYVDSAVPELIRSLRQSGFNALPAEKGPGSVYKGILLVKQLPLFITKDSINLISELCSYVWKGYKDGTLIDEPVKLNDDACDALRYPVQTYGKKYWFRNKTNSSKIAQPKERKIRNNKFQNY